MNNVFLTALAETISMTHSIATHHATAPKIQDIKLPKTNLISMCRIGDCLLESGKVTSISAFVLPYDITIFGTEIKAGEYHQVGIKEEHKTFALKGSSGLADRENTRSTLDICIDCNTDQLGVWDSTGSFLYSDEIRPNITEVNVYEPDCYMQELIYTGKIDGKVRFTFREFQNGVANQSFSTDVEYDLKVSNLISYKEALVQIISVTNRKIIYKVLKHFN